VCGEGTSEAGVRKTGYKTWCWRGVRKARKEECWWCKEMLKAGIERGEFGQRTIAIGRLWRLIWRCHIRGSMEVIRRPVKGTSVCRP
jgi:hypothetical protein